MKGGFSFHPSDEDLSPGSPGMKKPLKCVVSVYTNSETTVVGFNKDGCTAINPQVWLRSIAGPCELRFVSQP